MFTAKRVTLFAMFRLCPIMFIFVKFFAAILSAYSAEPREKCRKSSRIKAFANYSSRCVDFAVPRNITNYFTKVLMSIAKPKPMPANLRNCQNSSSLSRHVMS
jgi:hypothetical protein